MPDRDEIHVLAVQKNDINLFPEPVRDEILSRVPRVVGNRRTDEELYIQVRHLAGLGQRC